MPVASQQNPPPARPAIRFITTHTPKPRVAERQKQARHDQNNGGQDHQWGHEMLSPVTMSRTIRERVDICFARIIVRQDKRAPASPSSVSDCLAFHHQSGCAAREIMG